MAQGPLTPSDEDWAQHGIFFSYNKAMLSYGEVERLLRLADLDISREDFRNAAEVVWVYRYRPRSETPAEGFMQPSSGSSSSSAFGGAEDGGASVTDMPQLVGFASADIMLPPTSPPPLPPGNPRAGAVAASPLDSSGARRRQQRRQPENIRQPESAPMALLRPPKRQQRHLSEQPYYRGGSGACAAPTLEPARHPSAASAGGPAPADAVDAAAMRPSSTAVGGHENATDTSASVSSELAPSATTAPPASAAPKGAAANTAAATTAAAAPATAAASGAAMATATIWFLAVHPGCRGLGLGRALLERLVLALRVYGMPCTTLRSTSRAASFYDHLGLLRDRAAPLVKGPPGGVQTLRAPATRS